MGMVHGLKGRCNVAEEFPQELNVSSFCATACHTVTLKLCCLLASLFGSVWHSFITLY